MSILKAEASEVAFDLNRKIEPIRMLLAYVGAFIAMVLAVVAIVWVVQPASRVQLRDTPAARESIPVVDNALISDGREGRPLSLVAGFPMFPLPGDGVLTRWNDAPVVSQAVPVQSLARNGFWMGIDQVQRVYVNIPNSAVDHGAVPLGNLQIGQLVNVTGRMQALPDNLLPFGLDMATQSKLETAGRWLVANDVRVVR